MNYKCLPKKFFTGKQDQSHVYMWKEKLAKNFELIGQTMLKTKRGTRAKWLIYREGG